MSATVKGFCFLQIIYVVKRILFDIETYDECVKKCSLFKLYFSWLSECVYLKTNSESNVLFKLHQET